jgi:hypothetical protein
VVEDGESGGGRLEDGRERKRMENLYVVFTNLR